VGAYYQEMIAAARTPRPGRLAAIPAPRRLPAALAIAASVGVFTTSLRALPAVVLFPLGAAWLAAFAAGALASRKGGLILTVLAALTKTVTVVLIIWAITRPHSPVGPHTALDWVPLGLLNAGTGLWLLAVIRHRAR
jgi:4-amino-4-deoxy-L-arabinose transferase-like glycosyltransferase